MAGSSVGRTGSSRTQLDVAPTMLASQPGTGPHIGLHTLTYCGFSLSPATETFPRKLVEKVRSGQFVEMRELLRDNISLLGQLETLGGQSGTTGASRPRLREISSIASWMYSFLAYVAIRSSEESTRDMLAYGRLIIREAQQHGAKVVWTMIPSAGCN